MLVTYQVEKGSIMMWETIDELAKRLKCSEEYICGLIKSGKIPYCTLPGTNQIRFNSERIDSWLLNYEENKTNELSGGLDFVSVVLNIFKCDYKKTTKYINLYKDRRVFAQLHPSDAGINLVFKEGSDDAQLLKCQFLQQVELENLNGFWKANKGWLLGDGTRFTTKKAIAFNIPQHILKNSNHPSWTEILSLLKHAKDKC
jgi:excisionase family DNA binding protein